MSEHAESAEVRRAPEAPRAASASLNAELWSSAAAQRQQEELSRTRPASLKVTSPARKRRSSASEAEPKKGAEVLKKVTGWFDSILLYGIDTPDKSAPEARPQQVEVVPKPTSPVAQRAVVANAPALLVAEASQRAVSLPGAVQAVAVAAPVMSKPAIAVATVAAGGDDTKGADWQALLQRKDVSADEKLVRMGAALQEQVLLVEQLVKLVDQVESRSRAQISRLEARIAQLEAVTGDGE